ncbi:hypothetical protein Daus18300_002727 [Diaporthe australafricana]|uniref:Uncharacterized protein n=1 Tax=Diaporthe australafricana TaxID=127596 RepID=A0ABR3XKI0_9PEZI
MLGRRLAYVLAGLGAPAWAAPVLSKADTSPQSVPKGCIPEVWEQAHFCIIAPPTTTIGPSNKIRDATDEVLEARAAETPSPVLEITGTPTDSKCIPIVWNGVFICIAPPTTTIGPSTKRSEAEVLADRDTPSPTPTDSKACAIWQGVIICWEPPKTTIGPSDKRGGVEAAADVEKKDVTGENNGGGWGGGGLIPDTPVPGGPLVPGPYVPGGPLIPGPYLPGSPVTPDPSIPGGEMTPDPAYPGGEVTSST